MPRLDSVLAFLSYEDLGAMVVLGDLEALHDLGTLKEVLTKDHASGFGHGLVLPKERIHG